MEIREKGMIETHMGFELECWSWCFCHECFEHTRERDEWAVLGGCLISKTKLCVLDGPPPLLLITRIYIYITLGQEAPNIVYMLHVIKINFNLYTVALIKKIALLINQ